MSEKRSYEAVLARIIEEGIEAARQDYTRPDDADKLRGSVEGFEMCRDLDPGGLAGVLERARKDTLQAHRDEAPDYWRIRCAELEVEWVCNVLSAVLMNQGLPVIVPPTARGAMKAAEIVGVAAS